MLAILALSPAAPPALAADPPADAGAFTAHAADLMRRQFPSASVSVAGPLRLSVAAPGKTAPNMVYLDRVWAFCERNRPQCAAALQDLVRTMGRSAFEELEPASRQNLRAAVRPVGQVEQMRAAYRAAGSGEQPIAAALTAELWTICYVDSPRTARPLQRADLPKLGITADEALSLAAANTLKHLRPLSAVLKSWKGQSIGFMPGDYYESSRLLDHRRWERYAKVAQGHLIVAVPANNLVIYGNGADPGTVEAMRRMVREAATTAERPLSLTLLKWTKEGWQPLPP